MKVIKDWRSAWKWYSVNCPALAAALLASWALLPQAMQDAFSPLELKVAAITLIVMGVGGRFIDQSKPQ